ncbi:hypothetical protein SETIT_2G059100v2, partial [Setaria italica]
SFSQRSSFSQCRPPPTSLAFLTSTGLGVAGGRHGLGATTPALALALVRLRPALALAWLGPMAWPLFHVTSTARHSASTQIGARATGLAAPTQGAKSRRIQPHHRRSHARRGGGGVFCRFEEQGRLDLRIWGTS